MKIRGFYQGLIIVAAVVLTAKAGKIRNGSITESWYDLNMSNVIARSDAAIGVPDLYHIDDRGVKMYGPWVIVAAHPSKVRYTRVETSLGEGIILDYHTVDDPNLYDIATDWKDGDGK